MYQGTYILYQVLSVYTFMIQIMNEITDKPPAEFGVNNGNEIVMHEYGLDDFVQVQHDGDYHGQYDNIKDTRTIN